MLNHLTKPRLTTVENFFRTRSDAELLGCYAWCQAVGASLLPILGDFEVSLRNALHRGLSQYYGRVDSFDWMMKTKPNPAKQKNPAAPDLAWHSMKKATHDEIQKVVGKINGRKGANSATIDDIVAKLSFGFWETIVRGMNHNTHPADLKVRVLAVAFTNAPDLATTSYADAAFVRRLVDLLYQVRDVRNRIGHHDQIWKTPEFDSHGRLGFIPRRPRHTIGSLRMLCERISWLAGWIDPSITAHIRSSDHWWSLQALLSQEALAVYRKNGGQVGTYEAIIRTAPSHGYVAWPNDAPGIPLRAHQLNNRIITKRFYF